MSDIDKFLCSNWEKVILLSAGAVFCCSFIAYLMFNSSAGLVTIGLASIGISPVLYFLFVGEDNYDIRVKKELSRIKHHYPLFKSYLYILIGGFITFFLIYLFFPENFSRAVFWDGGLFTSTSWDVNPMYGFILNDLKIMIASLVLSLFYGIGAIFLIVWNSSLLGMYLAEFIKNVLHNPSLVFVSGKALLAFMAYGIPSIVAYVFAGFGGGILSISFLKGFHKRKNFSSILVDAGLFFGMAILFFVISSVIKWFVLY